MSYKSETDKKLGFPFLKIIRFNFQPFWNNLSQKLGVNYDVFGHLPVRIKEGISVLSSLR